MHNVRLDAFPNSP